MEIKERKRIQTGHRNSSSATETTDAASVTEYKRWTRKISDVKYMIEETDTLFKEKFLTQNIQLI